MSVNSYFEVYLTLAACSFGMVCCTYTKWRDITFEVQYISSSSNEGVESLELQSQNHI